MFKTLSNRLLDVLYKVKSINYLTDGNIKDTLDEVRKILLEADVALPVVCSFIDQVKKEAIGKKLQKGLTPGQGLIKIVYHVLIKIMGGEYNHNLNLGNKLPAPILMVGLQGSGKTTSIIKLAKFLQQKQNKKVLVVSTDTFRPAGMEQLKSLALSASIDFFPSSLDFSPSKIAELAVNMASINFYEVLLVDTPGCIHIDQDNMSDIIKVHSVICPIETLFVVDAMIGQDSANVANLFNKSLPLTGIILTKLDGDSRGGAAFSMHQITGKPIKFVGVGESIHELELFSPVRLVKRILDMGDMLSLIEDIENKTNRIETERLINKLKKGDSFNFFDFMSQLKQMRSMGGISKIINKLPGFSHISNKIQENIDDKLLIRMESIINSMTIQERLYPKIIKGSRKQRIALGAGVYIQDVTKLLKQFDDMKKIMEKINDNSMLKMMELLRNNKLFSMFKKH